MGVSTSMNQDSVAIYEERLPCQFAAGWHAMALRCSD